MATVDDILRATMVGSTLDGQVFNLVHHYIVTAGIDTDYADVASDICGEWGTSYAFIEASIHADTDSLELELAEWDFVNDEFDGKATITCDALAGADITDPHPGGVAYVVRFITAELRRQGRKFIPGVVESLVSGNNISGGMLVDLALYAADLNNPFVAGALSLTMCTFNSTPGSPRFETESLFTNTAFVNSRVGYQRRRQVGDGV